MRLCILQFSYRGGFAPRISKMQNTQPQLSQLIHPKPHPNGASNLHPLGWISSQWQGALGWNQPPLGWIIPIIPTTNKGLYFTQSSSLTSKAMSDGRTDDFLVINKFCLFFVNSLKFYLTNNKLGLKYYLIRKYLTISCLNYSQMISLNCKQKHLLMDFNKNLLFWVFINLF